MTTPENLGRAPDASCGGDGRSDEVRHPSGGDVELVNLTPHALAITAVDGRVVDVPVGGTPARVVSVTSAAGSIELAGVRIRLTRTPATGEVVGLPDPAEGRLLVVSRVVAEACPHRSDLVFPDELIRDADGTVVGCATLSSFTPPPRPDAEGPGASSFGAIRPSADQPD